MVELVALGGGTVAVKTCECAHDFDHYLHSPSSLLGPHSFLPPPHSSAPRQVSQLRLVVLDEAHHAEGGHPYAVLLRHFLNPHPHQLHLKQRGCLGPAHVPGPGRSGETEGVMAGARGPSILGLTASPYQVNMITQEYALDPACTPWVGLEPSACAHLTSRSRFLRCLFAFSHSAVHGTDPLCRYWRLWGLEVQPQVQVQGQGQGQVQAQGQHPALAQPSAAFQPWAPAAWRGCVARPSSPLLTCELQCIWLV